MKYEVMHGGSTAFVQAGNPYAACLEMLYTEADENDIEFAPFEVTPLPYGESETIPMALVVAIQNQALNGDPDHFLERQ
jgi:hypothetical protein